MTVLVRNATVEDIDELMVLRREVAGEGRWIGAELPLDEEGDRAIFTESAERGSLFVAEVDGALVGMLGMHLPRYMVADLGMNVKDGYRGQGIGSALVERAIAWAREAGAHKIALQHWPHNTLGPGPVREVRLRAGGVPAPAVPPEERRDLGRRGHGPPAGLTRRASMSADPGVLPVGEGDPMKRWLPLVALATAQFVMVLDQSVMNVSISQLVEDFDTTVSTIQAVITLYCLVMAMLMLTGGKIGDIIGRRRAFVIGLIIYACGSALTAVAPTVAVLTLGWSILEGIGAALVLPAMAALIAGNFEGESRKGAYAIIGGVAGAGIAIGPILGGWATTELSWRVVFAGEVVLVLFILAMVRYVVDTPIVGEKPRLDIVGSVLAATGLGTVVLGTLQSSTWGWVAPEGPHRSSRSASPRPCS